MAAAKSGGSKPAAKSSSKSSSDKGKHDLVFYEKRSTPKVVPKGKPAPEAPAGHGKQTSRRAAKPDEEANIKNPKAPWLRVDEKGNKPSDANYKKTQARPGLAKKKK